MFFATLIWFRSVYKISSCCWFCIHFWIKWELWKTFDEKMIGWTHFSSNVTFKLSYISLVFECKTFYVCCKLPELELKVMAHCMPKSAGDSSLNCSQCLKAFRRTWDGVIGSIIALTAFISWPQITSISFVAIFAAWVCAIFKWTIFSVKPPSDQNHPLSNHHELILTVTV